MSFRNQFLALGLAAATLAACGGGDDKPKAPGGGGDKPAATKPSDAPKAAAGGAYDAAKGTASIKGVVKFKGVAPPITKYNMDSTPGCKAHGDATIEKTEVNADGSLPHVFVYVVEGPAAGLSGYATAALSVDQKGCVYQPHVFGVVDGSTVTFKNSDDMSHNVHIKGKKHDWNKSQSAGGADPYKATPKEFGVKIICDVHSWMSSWMHIMAHPFFAVSARGNGAFEIKGLYPGKYKLKAWHENWAKDKQIEFEVEVKDGENSKDLEING